MTSRPLQISLITARRYILGRQGLWPGRRWSGKTGAIAALNEIEALQLDPLNIAARSHDIALYGRVLGYAPAHLDEAIYRERRFFDFGGGLFVYPMAEFPYWRLHMRRFAHKSRWAAFAAQHPDSVALVRAALQERGPLGNRDFAGSKRFEGNYRGRKDTALALYYLWITGEVMIHHRQNFQRYYDLTSRILPQQYDYEVTEAETVAYFARKEVAFNGLIRRLDWASALSSDIQHRLSAEEARALLDELIDAQVLAEVQVEGWKEPHYLLAEDLPVLDTLASGGIPPRWQPVGPTTEEEAVILAPLEIASARGRARKLFNFEYIWEVYKPAHLRRWGYYTVPILWGDRLVARLDPRLNRKTGVLHIDGFWLEDPGLASDPAFLSALSAGLRRFAGFAGAREVEAGQAPVLSL